MTELMDPKAVWSDWKRLPSLAVAAALSAAAAQAQSVPPTIITQPISQAAPIGSNVTFAVTATGTAPLSYQWQFYGTNVGLLTNTLTIMNVTTSHAGSYQVVVTNLFGSTTSAAAILTVGPPSLISQPLSQTAVIGSNVTLSVSVSGASPITYRWRRNGTNLPNNVVVALAGNGSAGYSGDGWPATSYSLRNPSGVAVGVSGAFLCDFTNNQPATTFYIADTGNGRIRMVDSYGTISTVSTASGSPAAVALDGSQNLFIADPGTNMIRRLNTNGIETVVAGTGFPGYSGDGGPATLAALNSPKGLAVDPLGNIYIADTSNNRIRKVATNGIITTYAGGGKGQSLGDGGAATNAVLSAPSGLALSYSGDLFIADCTNSRIRRVDTNGIIWTVAGNGANGYSGDGGAGILAKLNHPQHVALDAFGDLLIADRDNISIRKLDPNGFITTVVGGPTNLGLPYGVALDAPGNLYVADYQANQVRGVLSYASYPALKLNNAGTNDAGAYSVVISNAYGSVTSSVAILNVGTPSITAQPLSQAVPAGSNATFSVTAQGAPPLAYVWYFNGVAVAPGATNVFSLANLGTNDSGTCFVVVTNLYGAVTSSVATLTVFVPPSIVVQPANQTVLAGSSALLSVQAAGTGPFTYQWQFNGTNIPNDIITTVAGNGIAGFSGDGGPATNARLQSPAGLALDVYGNLYVADRANQRIRRVDNSGIIATVAGNGTSGIVGDGNAATNTRLSNPWSAAFDQRGNLYIGDSGHSRIRRVDTNGIIWTVAGNGTGGYSGDGGAATNARISANGGGIATLGVALDAPGNLYIADTFNSRVRKVDTNGIITTVAGNGAPGFSGDGGVATNASLYSPQNVASDPLGQLYIDDSNINHRIRKVATNGIITTIAGNGSFGFSGDGGLATNAGLSSFQISVALDGFGNPYIADGSRIRKIDRAGIITTVVGNGTSGYGGDGGPATNASLTSPLGLASDPSGNLFIADSSGNRIRTVPYGGYPLLKLDRVNSSNSGTYAVIVSSPWSCVTSSVVTLTIAVPPQIEAITQMNGTLTFTWSAVSSLAYQVQYTLDLGSPNWIDLAGPVTATNSSMSASDAVGPDPRRFYRVVLLP
jgi:sugar lactone lactonase YvrE